MLHYYLKRMESKELFILHNIGLSKGKVLFDGRPLYQYPDSDDFSTCGKDLYKKLGCNYPKYYKMDNLCKLAFLAGEFLVNKSEITNIPSEKVSLIFANTGSTIDTDSKFVESIETIPSPAIFVYTLPNITIGELCIRHGWKGEGVFLVQSRFNPKELKEHAEFIFQTGNTQICILGWVEFISQKEYSACLWLVSDTFDKEKRLLSDNELEGDFNIHL
jgi:hypothetical protein